MQHYPHEPLEALLACEDALCSNIPCSLLERFEAVAKCDIHAEDRSGDGSFEVTVTRLDACQESAGARPRLEI